MCTDSFLKIFDKNLKNNPNKIISSDFEQSLSWLEFVEKANYYANQFESLEQNIIPILVDRSVNTPCAIVGSIISKKIFVPISSKQPRIRIEKILNQLNIKYFLNLGNIQLSRQYQSINLIKQNKSRKNFNLENNINGAMPIYILFTSGSTGDPKGVLVSHENLLNTIRWSYTYQRWQDSDIVGITTNFGFDISLFDLFSSLCSNIPHYILKDSSDPFNSGREILENKITSIFSSPSFFSSLIKSDVINSLNESVLRQIFSGGDFFPASHMNKFKQEIPKLDIYNVWGPTETSIVNTMHRVSDEDIVNALKKMKAIPIGIMNHKLMPCFIIDENRDLKINEPFKLGEIVVTGEAVSLGYLNNQENKDFVQIKNNRYFYTNDLGYFDESNNLFITGRKGFMIKFNGYRLNLKEIESQALDFPLIHQVLAFNPKKYKEFIFIAIELENGLNKILKFGELRSFLRKKLPNYMIPKKMIIIEDFPKNINGKIDRKLTEIKALEKFENS